MTHIQTMESKVYGKYYLIDDIKILPQNWNFHKKTNLFTTKQKKDFELTKNIKKSINKYFLLKVYKKDQRYLLIKNTKFNFLTNVTILL